MPKHPSHYVYEPSSLIRQPARTTPYDQTKLMKSPDAQTGKLGGLGPKVSGGTMNAGGKRRPSGRFIKRGTLN